MAKPVNGSEAGGGEEERGEEKRSKTLQMMQRRSDLGNTRMD
jgi:hypothetical protein